ncbi:MAG: cation-translocating P-type ATPase, partial [Candidatus Nanoarchaeia archaeon]
MPQQRIPEPKPWHALTKEEVFKELKTSEKGLTEVEAKKRLESYGKNVIKRKNKLRPLKILFSQFNSFLVYILIVAAAISFLIDHFLDGVVISVIIILNSGIGFFQQYRAERAVLNLRKLLIPKSKVLRNGKLIEIPSAEIVPGDVVELQAGDKINADSRIIESERLQTDESTLTGESLPVFKSAKKLSKQTILAEQENRLFAGTKVVRGSAKAVIVSTGMNTVFGKIAQSLQEIEVQTTPMQKRLDTFSKQIGIIILILVVLVIVLGLSKSLDPIEMFLTAVALAVSAIPEGLPAVLTISFAISSLMMSKQNVIIRRLPAVESLGSVTVICSDKTGTITEEKMRVQELFHNNKFYIKKGKKLFLKDKLVNFKANKGLFQLLKTSILCNNARFERIKGKYEILGDPTEKALVSMSLDLGLDKKLMTESEPRIKEFEFTSKRKMMSVVRNLDSGRTKVIYSKGALEEILKISSFEFSNNQIKKLTEKRKVDLLNYSKEMEKDALRVLGLAYKNTH